MPSFSHCCAEVSAGHIGIGERDRRAFLGREETFGIVHPDSLRAQLPGKPNGVSEEVLDCGVVGEAGRTGHARGIKDVEIRENDRGGDWITVDRDLDEGAFGEVLFPFDDLDHAQVSDTTLFVIATPSALAPVRLFRPARHHLPATGRSLGAAGLGSGSLCNSEITQSRPAEKGKREPPAACLPHAISASHAGPCRSLGAQQTGCHRWRYGVDLGREEPLPDRGETYPTLAETVPEILKDTPEGSGAAALAGTPDPALPRPAVPFWIC